MIWVDIFVASMIILFFVFLLLGYYKAIRSIQDQKLYKGLIVCLIACIVCVSAAYITRSSYSKKTLYTSDYDIHKMAEDFDAKVVYVDCDENECLVHERVAVLNLDFWTLRIPKEDEYMEYKKINE